MPEALELYLDAFYDLDSERSHAAGFTCIPWHSIVTYARFHAFSEDQAETLLHHIRVMDRAHIERLESKYEAERNKGK